MRTLGVVLGLTAFACGSVQGEELPVDAPPLVDADPVVVSHRFVIEAFQIPANNTQALENGLDLDGNGVIDNQIGEVLATFAAMGIDTKPATKAAVDRGTSITLVELRATDVAASTNADVALFTGMSPSPMACANANDPVCRHHLDGMATIVAATAPVNPPLVGDFVAGTLIAGPGQLAVDLVLRGGGLARFALIGAKIRVTGVTDAGARLIIAGAATRDEVESKIYPAIRLEAMSAMTRDCTNTTPPACGCQTSSIGATYATLFDTAPENCVISPEEIAGNALISSLFEPDVMVGNVMATSFGVGATAVKATFTPP